MSGQRYCVILGKGMGIQIEMVLLILLMSELNEPTLRGMVTNQWTTTGNTIIFGTVVV